MKKNWILLAIGVLTFIIFNTIFIKLYPDLLWFESFGASSVWWLVLKSKMSIFVSVFAISFVFLAINLMIALKFSKNKVTVESEPNTPLAAMFNQFFQLKGIQVGLKTTDAIYRLGLWLAVFGISCFLALIAKNFWQVIYLFFAQVSFHAAEPIFGRDIGFYLFSLPFFQHIYALLFGLVLISVGFIGWIYFSRNLLAVILKQTANFNQVKMHLFILLSLFFAIYSFGKWLRLFSIMYDPEGLIYGPGYANVVAQLIGLKLVMAMSIITTITFLIFAFKKGFRIPFYSAIGIILVSFIGVGIIPNLVQQFIVAPNELMKETPFIKNNIYFTRLAYGLNKIQEVEFPVKYNLTFNQIQNNPSVINNIRLWSPEPLKQTISQLQEIRPYYSFISMDDDRYKINNNLQQVYLTARELDINHLPPKAQTWVNQHLIYTHGYGVCMAPVNIVTQEGLPHLFIKDFPTTSSIDFPVKQPGIYFGEKTSGYALVNTKEKEFDYPQGNANVYAHYTGSGGIQLDSFLKRLIYSMKFSEMNLVISPQLTNESRILYNRDIRSIVTTIAPFLEFDSDPYVMIGKDGRLYWIFDAYTTSEYFPWAEPFNRYLKTNYIRNAVKVTIDAYNGTVKFYIADTKDPLIQAYAKIYQGLFLPIDQMPSDIKQHLRYPKDLFMVQAAIYRTFHMTDPQVFYNREDIWDIPQKNADEEGQNKIAAYYTITKLPGESEASYILMLPFSPKGKNNMISWLSAKCDWNQYGQLKVFQFPKERTIYGPVQIESRIDQDTEISQRLTLWGQLGSRVIRGDLQVIPIEESLIYVEPIYLQATQSKFPEFKRVVFSYDDTIIMDETLDNAIRQTFGETATVSKGRTHAPVKILEAAKTGVSDIIKQLSQEFNDFKTQAKNNNWVQFGERLSRVDQLVQELVKSNSKKGVE